VKAKKIFFRAVMNYLCLPRADMNLIKIAVASIFVGFFTLGGYSGPARAANAMNYIYFGNQLVEVDFDDGTSIQYGYDGNGNLISKTTGGTPGGGSQFYTITASCAPQGTGEILPWGQQSVSVPIIPGGDCTFTFAPTAPNYYLSSVTVDGNPVGAPESYTFTNVTGGHMISALFVTGTYPITVSTVPADGSGGTITPSSQMIAQGGNQVFSISPKTGWYITQVYVDGNLVGEPSSYTFSNVSAPHTIAAYFQIYTFTITTSTIGGGSISPVSPIVNYGANQTFTITPPQGITIYDVQADGVSQGPITSYIFTNVTANHTLSANFSEVKNVRTSALYQHLQDAYNAAQNGDTLLVQSGLLTENFTANQNISVTIDGGYTSDYSSNPGVTTISGLQTISNGTVTWKNFVISN
jgi:YD repeat-containing protein